MKRFSYFILILSFFIMIFPTESFCQFHKIFRYYTPKTGEKKFFYWLSYIPSSDHSREFFGEEVEREGLFSHSLEMEYGLSNRFAVALYLDFEHPRYCGIKWVNTKAVMVRYRFYEKHSRPIDMAIYAEYKLPKKQYKDYEELELRLILEKDFGFHTFVTNPTFEKKVSGRDIDKGVEFSFGGGYYYKRSSVVQPGIEFYSKMGEVRDTELFKDQESYVFPTVDILFDKGVVQWHVGVGIGLTDPSDNIILKSIISYGFL